MECLYCKAEMVKSTAPFSVDRKGYHITWESIPAWVCSQCGEAMFEDKEVELVQKALEKLDQETSEMLKSA